MKHVKKVGSTLLAAAAVSLFSVVLTGCDADKKSAPESKPSMDASKNAAQSAAENPATAKPKDHPAH